MREVILKYINCEQDNKDSGDNIGIKIIGIKITRILVAKKRIKYKKLIKRIENKDK